ncbi:MAG: hypothetical protein J6W04_00320 [Bacteroidales bacterium]|nr:hypothetical protein [Bacteroidales bacterium]
MEKTKQTFAIYSQNLDFTSKASLLSLGNMVLDIAGIDANKKGFGVDAVLSHNYAWVAMRMRLRILRYPEESENVNAETWIENWSKFTTQRDCVMTDDNGNRIMEAAIIFTLIDFNLRQTVNMLDKLPDYGGFINPDILETCAPGKVRPPQNETLIGQHTVSINDLDVNMHVNSFRYIAWILDCIPIDLYKENKITEIEINFIHEILYGETVTIYYEKIEDNVYIFDIHNHEGISANRCKLTFVPVCLLSQNNNRPDK